MVVIEPGQIWVRRPDMKYLPEDTWKVLVVNVGRNRVTYKVIEYNGERTNGVQISIPRNEFLSKYYLERHRNGDDH